MWLQAKQSFRFIKPVDNIDQAMQDMANQVKDSSVVIVAGETKEMPSWIRGSWIFDLAIEEGLLLEIVMPKGRSGKKRMTAPPANTTVAAEPPAEPEPEPEPEPSGEPEQPPAA